MKWFLEPSLNLETWRHIESTEYFLKDTDMIHSITISYLSRVRLCSRCYGYNSEKTKTKPLLAWDMTLLVEGETVKNDAVLWYLASAMEKTKVRKRNRNLKLHIWVQSWTRSGSEWFISGIEQASAKALRWKPACLLVRKEASVASYGKLGRSGQSGPFSYLIIDCGWVTHVCMYVFYFSSFIYFWLHWVFVAASGLSLVEVGFL